MKTMQMCKELRELGFTPEEVDKMRTFKLLLGVGCRVFGKKDLHKAALNVWLDAHFPNLKALAGFVLDNPVFCEWFPSNVELVLNNPYTCLFDVLETLESKYSEDALKARDRRLENLVMSECPAFELM